MSRNNLSWQENLRNHGPYVGIMSGANFYNLKHIRARISPGYYCGGFAGYKFSNNIRVEVEASYQRSPVTKRYFAEGNVHRGSGNAYSWSCIANCLFDLDLDFPVTPYFGGGIGYSQIIAHYEYRHEIFNFMPQS